MRWRVVRLVVGKQTFGALAQSADAYAEHLILARDNMLDVCNEQVRRQGWALEDDWNTLEYYKKEVERYCSLANEMMLVAGRQKQ
jgi:hypothetical protein